MSMHAAQARAFVLAPAPILTITIEANSDGDAEVHLHPGSQGVWIARMLVILGIDVTLGGAFGGEVGRVVRGIVEREGVEVRAIDAGNNGAYVHDRRSGERKVVADVPTAVLTRHEVDELYGACLVAALDTDVCVLGGSGPTDILPADTYRRLAKDLRSNDKRVVVDLSGDALRSALDGGVDVCKVSHEEVCRDGWARDADDRDALLGAVRDLAAAGAANVVLTRAAEPTLGLLDGRVVEVTSPHLEPLDPHGAGDSLTAGVTAGLARGLALTDALCLGSAAGSLNVTRRGLASGHRRDIEALAQRVQIRELA